MADAPLPADRVRHLSSRMRSTPELWQLRRLRCSCSISIPIVASSRANSTPLPTIPLINVIVLNQNHVVQTREISAACCTASLSKAQTGHFLVSKSCCGSSNRVNKLPRQRRYSDMRRGVEAARCQLRERPGLHLTNVPRLTLSRLSNSSGLCRG